MYQYSKRPYSYLAVGFLGVALFLLQFNNILPTIGSAYPVLLLPFVLYCGAYFGAFSGVLTGAITGMAMDIYTGGSPSFHMVMFCIIGCASGFFITYYLNRNWQALTILTLSLCLFYYFVKWLCFYNQPGGFVSYFLTTGILSALYTAILGLPIYLLISWVLRLVENGEK